MTWSPIQNPVFLSTILYILYIFYKSRLRIVFDPPRSPAIHQSKHAPLFLFFAPQIHPKNHQTLTACHSRVKEFANIFCCCSLSSPCFTTCDFRGVSNVLKIGSALRVCAHTHTHTWNIVVGAADRFANSERTHSPRAFTPKREVKSFWPFFVFLSLF